MKARKFGYDVAYDRPSPTSCKPMPTVRLYWRERVWPPASCEETTKESSSETQGQIEGARESLNGRKNKARRKVKNGEKSPWWQCLTRPVPNGRGRSGFWLVPEKHKFSKQKGIENEWNKMKIQIWFQPTKKHHFYYTINGNWVANTDMTISHRCRVCCVKHSVVQIKGFMYRGVFVTAVVVKRIFSLDDDLSQKKAAKNIYIKYI